MTVIYNSMYIPPTGVWVVGVGAGVVDAGRLGLASGGLIEQATFLQEKSSMAMSPWKLDPITPSKMICKNNTIFANIFQQL